MKKQTEVLNDQLKKAKDDKNQLTRERDCYKRQAEKNSADALFWKELCIQRRSRIEELRKEVKDANDKKNQEESVTKERDDYKQEVQAKKSKIEELEKSLNNAEAEIKSMQEESKKAQLKSAKRMREALEEFDEPLEEVDALQSKRIKTD